MLHGKWFGQLDEFIPITKASARSRRMQKDTASRVTQRVAVGERQEINTPVLVLSVSAVPCFYSLGWQVSAGFFRAAFEARPPR